MNEIMENLLHYVWQHRLFPLGELRSTDGQTIEVIDTGLHNFGAGPDFFNAKIRIGEQLWMGNVEIHLRSSDWYRHHHETDEVYNNVILHVVQQQDCAVETENKRRLPQIELPIPENVKRNYNELLSVEAYPPCYRIINQLPTLFIHSWLSALTVERLISKTERINGWLERTSGDWERTFFIILARAFGFGTNADAFEQWASTINPQQIGKHRDNAFQVEAFFLGQAGLLAPPTEEQSVNTEKQTAEREKDRNGAKVPFSSKESHSHKERLYQEYRFLQAKFGLKPIPRKSWKFGRLRPQNSPEVRLSQLAELYVSHRLDFSKIREIKDINKLRKLLATKTLPSNKNEYTLSPESVDLLLINAVSPILFAYGRAHNDEELTARAFELLEQIRPEHNSIIRSWALSGIVSQHAADSQALIELKTHYCDRKDCLRCRFGASYLKKP